MHGYSEENHLNDYMQIFNHILNEIYLETVSFSNIYAEMSFGEAQVHCHVKPIIPSSISWLENFQTFCIKKY